MVEKTHTAGSNLAGWYPTIMGPLQGIGQHIAEFFSPQSDATATEAQYEINMELPGVLEDDIRIVADGAHLTVRGEKRIERKEEGKAYFFSERSFGTFQRSFRLPPDVEADRITAAFKDGILTIRAPKIAAVPETSRQIEITRQSN